MLYHDKFENYNFEITATSPRGQWNERSWEILNLLVSLLLVGLSPHSNNTLCIYIPQWFEVTFEGLYTIIIRSNRPYPL